MANKFFIHQSNPIAITADYVLLCTKVNKARWIKYAFYVFKMQANVCY